MKGKDKGGLLLHGSMTLRTKPLADGRKSLYIDHVINGKHTKKFLSLYLLPEETGKAKKLNASTMREAKNILKERQADLLKSQLDEENAEKTNNTLLSSWMDTYYNYLIGKGAKEDNTKHIFIVKSHLEKYRPGSTLSVIDRPFILGFIDFLRNDCRKKDNEPFSKKTIFNIVGIFSSSLNYAVREGRIPSNPYLTFEQSERPSSANEHIREYLTIDELKKMISTPCKDERVRRIFLFSCFTGLRISDVKNLRWRDFSYDTDITRIGIKMYKTQKVVYIPLSAQAKKWLPEYDENEEFVFSRIDSTNLNNKISQWAKAAGISKHITHHCARHTFATMMLTLGADIYTVSKLLGHASLRHTQRYAQIVDKQKDDAVNLADTVF